MSKPVQIFFGKLPSLKDLLSLNRILYVLIFSDFVVISAYGLLAPIFAVFLLERIVGGSLVVIGISEAIYLVTKSLIQVPIGILIDKTKGQKIDFWFLFIGNLLMSLSLFAYIWVRMPWHIYLISFVYGVGGAFAYPAWTGLFTRNIVEHKESFAWSFSTTFVEMGRAGAAILGAAIGEFLGFNSLFVVVGGLSLLGTFLLFLFYDDLIVGSHDELTKN
jgi:MFS family permease